MITKFRRTYKSNLVKKVPSTHVLVFEEAEHLELAEDALGGDERLEHVG